MWCQLMPFNVIAQFHAPVRPKKLPGWFARGVREWLWTVKYIEERLVNAGYTGPAINSLL